MFYVRSIRNITFFDVLCCLIADRLVLCSSVYDSWPLWRRASAASLKTYFKHSLLYFGIFIKTILFVKRQNKNTFNRVQTYILPIFFSNVFNFFQWGKSRYCRYCRLNILNHRQFNILGRNLWRISIILQFQYPIAENQNWVVRSPQLIVDSPNVYWLNLTWISLPKGIYRLQ